MRIVFIINIYFGRGIGESSYIADLSFWIWCLKGSFLTRVMSSLSSPREASKNGLTSEFYLKGAVWRTTAE